MPGNKNPGVYVWLGGYPEVVLPNSAKRMRIIFSNIDQQTGIKEGHNVIT